ncbi:hypothetical protein EELLY_v1c03340 [Entomoplasma ellychniae]|uniref:Uncharacterized protein n=1 Tax=Entomoplasma ellychniae TaxID=2114 RepID=A0A8E2QY97_9MOLU|nr:hypothetical protein [Entomoplasma ellychniae]PPE04654.1 hypothetical protein EELLY_v1c03340 [Entomoplasma ellychniae]
MNHDLKISLDKLKKIIKLIKTKTLNDQELENLLSFISQLIDNHFFKSSNLVNKLNKNLIKNNRIIDIKINSDSEMISSKDAHEFLYLLKTFFSLALSKKMFFNIYIFTEVNMIINYYIINSIKNKSYDIFNNRFKINELEYHNQVVMYKYLFSIFDKLIYISGFIVKKYNLTKHEIEKDLKFVKDFDKVAQPFFKNSLKKENTKIYLKLLNQSSSWHFLRKLRNNLEHSFSDNKSEFNISLETEMLFVLIARTLIQIHNDFKNDKELFKLIDMSQKVS